MGDRDREGGVLARGVPALQGAAAEQLAALERLLARPGFGIGDRTIGAELELFLVDANGRPLPISLDVLADVESHAVTPELARFEIELATAPVALAGRPFAALATDIARNARSSTRPRPRTVRARARSASCPRCDAAT